MRRMIVLAECVLTVAGAQAQPSDVLVDVNALAFRVHDAVSPAPMPARNMAIVNLAMFDAVNAIEQRYAAYRAQVAAPNAASPAAAAVGAGCAAISALYPTQRDSVQKECTGFVIRLPAGEVDAASIAFGESVGRSQVEARKDDGFGTPNAWRPTTQPGTYVPTAMPVGWDLRSMRPFAMREPSQFRPGPPPALASEAWARDYNEIKAIGSRSSTQRTPEQASIARYWYYSGVLSLTPQMQQAARAAGPHISDRARILALTNMAASDAGVAVFDAKYAYNFWRPLTAIRNGDIDGNDATERDAAWLPLLDAPMHPEYPCAHCITSTAVGEVLASVLGTGELATPLSAPAAGVPPAEAAVRSWRRVSDIATEMSNARIWSGIHFRNSTEVGAAMGREIGRYVLETQLKPR